MSDYAIPAYLGAPAECVEYDASGTAINKYDFVEADGSGGVKRASTSPFSTRPVGIAVRDERDSKVLVYIGKAAIAVKAADSDTLAVGDDVYQASVNTVEGEPEAVTLALAIGECVEIIGNKIIFNPIWSGHIEGSAAS